MAIFGVTAVLLIYAPLVVIAGTAGVWLFFVQHQFEDVYWRTATSGATRRRCAALYLKLPQPFQFFTGNIGLHHVHHLSSRVPNYSLQRAHDEVDAFADVPVLTFRKSLGCSRLKLWDERSKQLVTFREGRRSVDKAPLARPAAATPSA